MKKLLMIIFIGASALSCDNEMENALSIDPHEFFGLSKEQRSAMNVTKILKYTPLDKEYEDITKDLRIKSMRSIQEARTNIFVPEEAVYYEIYGESGKVVKMLQISVDKFFCDVYVPQKTVQSSVLRVGLTNASSGPRYFYTGKDTNGLLMGSNNSFDTQRTWWNCVRNEYYQMCLATLWRSVMCGAAAGAAPELGAVVLGAWMISCAW